MPGLRAGQQADRAAKRRFREVPRVH